MGAGDVNLIAKIAPKNDAFIGMVDVTQVIPNGSFSMGNYNIVTLADPINDQDAVNLRYMEASGGQWDRNVAQGYVIPKVNDDDVITFGNIGVGISGPWVALDVRGDTRTKASALSSYFGVGSLTGYIGQFRGRGTIENPEVVQNGDILGTIFLGGHDGTQLIPSSYIQTRATEDWTTTQRGSKVIIGNTKNGDAGFTNAATIDENLDLIIDEGNLNLVDSTTSISKDVSNNLTFTDANAGTLTLSQLGIGSGGITSHELLSNLNWANAGHTIDTDLVLGENVINMTEISTPTNPDANKLKVYAVDDSGTTKLATLDSSGTQTILNSGSGASTLPNLTDVDNALDYTNHFIFQGDGSQYTGATYSHTWLDDVGTNAHDIIDSHIDTGSVVHTLATNLLHTTGSETKAGLLTFSDTLPQSSVVPSNDSDLVNKTYVDGIALGLIAKEACKVATTASGTLATDFENGDTIDDTTLITGDRILIKNQTSATENGIYIVEATGAPTRASDYNSSAEVQEGTFCYILLGTVNKNKSFVQTTIDPVLDTDNLVFVQLSASTIYTADGQGIELTSTQFGLELDGSTLSKSASGLKLAAGMGTANQVLGMNDGATAQEYKTITAGANVSVTHTANDIEIASSLSGAPDYTYSDITMHSHAASSYTYTNLPIALTAASSYLRKKVDLTGAVQYRIVVNQAVAGYAGSKLRLRYSTNNSTFSDIDSDNSGDLDVGTGTGVKTGTWVDIVAGAKQDVWLQIYGWKGDGIVDPQFRQITIQIKYNSTIVDGSSSDVVYKEVTIHAHSTSNSVWTNMPSALTEFMATAISTRRKVNLTNCTHYRIVVNQAVAGFAGADFNIQYSTNGSTFQALDTLSAGELDVGTGTGIKYGAWATIVDAAKGDVWLRLVGKGGDGIVDPSWRYIAIQFKEYTYGQGVTGNDTEILFNDEGSTGTDSRFTYNNATNLVNGTFDFTTTGSISGGIITGSSLVLTNLTDDYIPYHVNDSTGLANGPTKTDVDSAVSLKHAAVTGSAPISLNSQYISIINDVATTITEIDTGALANSDSVIPTSKGVKTYVDGHGLYQMYDVLVDGTGVGDYTTIGSALSIEGSNKSFFVKRGTYTENVTSMGSNIDVYFDDVTLGGYILMDTGADKNKFYGRLAISGAGNSASNYSLLRVNSNGVDAEQLKIRLYPNTPAGDYSPVYAFLLGSCCSWNIDVADASFTRTGTSAKSMFWVRVNGDYQNVNSNLTNLTVTGSAITNSAFSSYTDFGRHNVTAFNIRNTNGYLVYGIYLNGGDNNIINCVVGSVVSNIAASGVGIAAGGNFCSIVGTSKNCNTNLSNTGSGNNTGALVS